MNSQLLSRNYILFIILLIAITISFIIIGDAAVVCYEKIKTIELQTAQNIAQINLESAMAIEKSKAETYFRINRIDKEQSSNIFSFSHQMLSKFGGSYSYPHWVNIYCLKVQK